MMLVKCMVDAAVRIALVCTLLGAGPAGALPFSKLFVFGDSLSDAGNNAIFFDMQAPPIQPRTPTPIPDNTFIPTFPYALSGRYTDQFVWAQYLGAALGLPPILPSLAGGTDFAFGGANTGPLGFALPPSLRTQVAMFLSAAPGGVAPGDALYVIAGGGNNARNALDAIGGGAPVLSTIAATAMAYADDVVAMIAALSGAGARDIIVWNTPDIGVTPAALGGGPLVSALGTSIAAAMNAELLSDIGGTPGVEIFDIFGLVQSISKNPGAFGLANASDACAFVGCDPSTYLFWDGIHPTSGGHQLIAQNMLLLAVPAPGTLLLLLAVLPVAVVSRWRRAA